MPKSFIVAPHSLHFGQLRLSALAGACRVMLRFSGWMVAGVQQESLEAFDKFITAGPNASRFSQSREARSSLLYRSFARRAACSSPRRGGPDDTEDRTT